VMDDGKLDRLEAKVLLFGCWVTCDSWMQILLSLQIISIMWGLSALVTICKDCETLERKCTRYFRWRKVRLWIICHTTCS
jgi:hypothetical protein